MATPRAYLKPAPDGTAHIMLRYKTHEGSNYVKSTGIRIHPGKFDPKKKEYINWKNGKVVKLAGAPEINLSITQQASAITSAVAKIAATGKRTTPDLIRAAIEETNEKANGSIVSYLGDILGTKEAPGTLRATIKHNSVKIYETLITHLKEYEKKQRTPIAYSDVNRSFFKGFIAHLRKTNAPNATRKLCGTLKTVLREAVRDGRTNSREFEDVRLAEFRLKKETPVTVYLSIDELEKIFTWRNSVELDNHKLKNILRREADRLILGCWLGLRWSDFAKVTKKNLFEIAGGWRLNASPEKTDDPVTIPIFPMALSILESYGMEAPPKISQQKANAYFKDVCRLAGIKEPVATPDGIFEKWKLITTHCCRRSFATNLVRLGFPEHKIMRLTGHKESQSFNRYVRITNEQAADDIAKEFAEAAAGMKIVHSKTA